MTAKRLLEIRDLHGWYGESHVLHGVNLHVDEGEVVTLLGRNGAGRTSTLRAIMGLIGRRKGSVRLHGTETIDLPPHKIARLGVGYCPEERGIFSSLSAYENLMLPPTLAAGGMSVEQIYAMFPNLRERAQPGHAPVGRRAADARGGAHPAHRRQAAAAGRDVEGLAPVIVQKLAEMVMACASRATPSSWSSRTSASPPAGGPFLVMEHGQVIQEFTQAELPQRIDQLHEILGV